MKKDDKFTYSTRKHQSIYKDLSESAHQVTIFEWSAAVTLFGLEVATMWVLQSPTRKERDVLNTTDYDTSKGDHRLVWLHSIPNGGSRGSNRADRQRQGAKMRAEGVKRGIPDIFLPVPKGASHGLYVELKRFGGAETLYQGVFAEHCKEMGYSYRVCTGYLAAIREITKYIES